jgi:hypothetical protein
MAQTCRLLSQHVHLHVLGLSSSVVNVQVPMNGLFLLSSFSRSYAMRMDGWTDWLDVPVFNRLVSFFCLWFSSCSCHMVRLSQLALCSLRF